MGQARVKAKTPTSRNSCVRNEMFTLIGKDKDIGRREVKSEARAQVGEEMQGQMENKTERRTQRRQNRCPQASDVQLLVIS